MGSFLCHHFILLNSCQQKVSWLGVVERVPGRATKFYHLLITYLVSMVAGHCHCQGSPKTLRPYSHFTLKPLNSLFWNTSTCEHLSNNWVKTSVVERRQLKPVKASGQQRLCVSTSTGSGAVQDGFLIRDDQFDISSLSTGKSWRKPKPKASFSLLSVAAVGKNDAKLSSDCE